MPLPAALIMGTTVSKSYDGTPWSLWLVLLPEVVNRVSRRPASVATPCAL